MTVIDWVKVVCAVCGNTSEQQELMSTNAFGYYDLDGRPPYDARGMIHLWLQYCDHCGYINYEINKLRPIARVIMDSQEYQNTLDNQKYPFLARLFLCNALFYPDDPLQAGNQILHAAWVCDDEQNLKLAREFRNRAANRLLALQPFTGEEGDINTGIQVVDILRRAGRGGEAMDLATRLLADPGVQADENMVKILQYQHQLCQNQDWSGYDIGHAFGDFSQRY